MKRYHLIGIGGMGMCGLAQVFLHEGISVSGSDRSYDRGENLELFSKLKRLGVKMYPQDGSGIDKGISKVIISRAIEDDNPDLVVAKRFKIPISYRQEELKKIFRRYSGIAVAGTSGKTTVVGMIACIFDTAGKDITVVNGGIMRNYVAKSSIGNVHIGRLPYFCIETDESEGDLKGYAPRIGVITNIGSDHMSRSRLKKVYKEFAKEVGNTLIFGQDIKAYDIKLNPSHSVFKVGSYKIRLSIPGEYNIDNALASIGAAKAWGISMNQIVKGLEGFKGIKRRFEILGEKNGVRVIDDYAHNPDKIRAALKTARLSEGRVIAIYQPHGYGPTRMFLKELAEVFNSGLGKKDFLFIPNIYYVGGSVKKDVSSMDIIREIKKRNKSLNAEYVPNRDDIGKKLKKISRWGDTILIMGARDVTLSDWAKGLLC